MEVFIGHNVEVHLFTTEPIGHKEIRAELVGKPVKPMVRPSAKIRFMEQTPLASV